MSTEGVNLLVHGPERRKADVQRCIICQKVKRSETLTSTENGRLKIRNASELLQDGILSDLNENEINQIQYHLKECYKTYVLRSKRVCDVPEGDTIETADVCTDSSTEGRCKRRKPKSIQSYASFATKNDSRAKESSTEYRK